MSTSLTSSSLVCERTRVSASARLLDYVELTKPKIAVLELVTVAVAACVARWNAPDAWVLLHALAGTALVAGSAARGTNGSSASVTCECRARPSVPCQAGGCPVPR